MSKKRLYLVLVYLYINNPRIPSLFSPLINPLSRSSLFSFGCVQIYSITVVFSFTLNK